MDPSTPFTIEHRVPWSDVDLARIVYFPRFLSYFEMAELEWYRHHGYGYEDALESFGIWMPRVAAHCNYRAPARLADLLVVQMHLERLGQTSFTFGYEAYRLPERTLIVDGYVAIVTVSRDAYRPIPIPETLGRLLRTLPSKGRSAVRTNKK